MTTLPLKYLKNHLFVECEGQLWLLDTGSPASFGDNSSVKIAGQDFRVDSNYLGLDAAAISRYVEIECGGLLGADLLGHFDHLIDISGQTLTVSTAELVHEGAEVPLDFFMGIPIVPVAINGSDYRMFFDTGARFSYFQDDSLEDFPAVGSVTDFHPGFGQFQTLVHEVPVELGSFPFNLRCGSLPDLLALTVGMGGAKGIIGNAVVKDRVVGFFPRRGLLCL